MASNGPSLPRSLAVAPKGRVLCWLCQPPLLPRPELLNWTRTHVPS